MELNVIIAESGYELPDANDANLIHQFEKAT